MRQSPKWKAAVTAANPSFTRHILPSLKQFLTTFTTTTGRHIDLLEHLSQFIPEQSISQRSAIDPQIQHWLAGRQLLQEEWPFSEASLNEYINQRLIVQLPGIVRRFGRLVCVRCSNDSASLFGSYDCYRCGKVCYYCRHCIMMGVIKSCTQLLIWNGPPPDVSIGDNTICRWEGQLSDRQSQAAQSLKTAVMERKDFLLWAVCGAGKTETLYPAIEAGLSAGRRVAFVSPRTDVIVELSERIRRAFPDLSFPVLYGDSPDEYTFTPFLIATTHQLLRFYQAFDTIIIDEIDAFPYNQDPSLKFAVEKAKKPGGSLVFVSATPEKGLKRQFQTRKLDGVTIPRRFHGKPLPVPQLKWVGYWRRQVKSGILPAPFEKWISQRYEEGRSIFIFVPSVKMLNRCFPLVQRLIPEAEGVHAEHPERHIIVRAFRDKSIPVVVTTTILERGVTIPLADVAILGAEDDRFDEKALVQMAGRAGRDQHDPDSQVVFFHFGVTLEITRAIEHIQSMNKKGGFDQ